MSEVTLIGLVLKNIGRNRRRSILTALSLFVASFVVVFMYAWIHGYLDASREMFTRFESSDVKIAKKAFFKRKVFLPVEEFIEDPRPIVEKIEARREVYRVTERIRFMGLFSRGETTKPAFFMSIDPESEKDILGYQRKVIEGKYDLDEGILVGKDMAASMNLRIGDTTIVLSRTSLGGLNGIKLTVRGILDLGTPHMNRNYSVIGIREARRLLKMGKGTTEILVFLKKREDANKFVETLDLPKDLEARDYLVQMGSLAIMYKYAETIYIFIYLFILGLASFAIINTMTMAVFERVREIGTLKALGALDWEIFLLFGLEGSLLGGMGGLLGALGGYLLSYLVSLRGINMEAMLKNVNLPIPYVIRPSADFGVFLFAFLLALGMSILSSLIPALHTRRLTPQEALRHV